MANPPRLSPAGKRLGRPPKAVAPSTAVVPVARPPVQLTKDAEIRKAIRKFSNKYDGGGSGKRMSGWQPPAAGPNRVLDTVPKLRSRARDVRRNDWSGESVSQKWATTLIGIGITPRFLRIANKTRRQEINDLAIAFFKTIDADGVLDYFGQQTLAVLSWADGGEVFVRRRPRKPDEDGLRVSLQVQLLESEMCPMDLTTDTYEGLPVGNRIQNGIELNYRGKRVAYWFYKDHPGDEANVNYTSKSLVRVAASQVSHMYEPTRPGQLRGVSLLAPVLTRLRGIGDYQDAVLLRQQIANLFVMFVTKKLPLLDPANPFNQMTGLADEIDEATGQPLVPLAPGLIQELEDGQDVTFANPPEAGTTYSDYIRTEQLGTAAGAGMPYELMSGDIKDISDRTLRVVMNEFRRLAERRQWQMVIPMYCQRVIEWFADTLVLQNDATLEEAELIKLAGHFPHGWAHIHPTQDPEGKKIEVEAGFRSRSSVISERGDDPDQVDDERAAEQKREKKLGILPPPGATGQAPAQSGGADPAEPPPGPEGQ